MSITQSDEKFDLSKLDELVDDEEPTFAERLILALSQGSRGVNDMYDEVENILSSSEISTEEKFDVFLTCAGISPDFTYECFRNAPPNTDFYLHMIRWYVNEENKSRAANLVSYVDYAVQHVLNKGLSVIIFEELFKLSRWNQKYYIQLFQIKNRLLRTDLANLIYNRLLVDFRKKVQDITDVVETRVTPLKALSTIDLTKGKRPKIMLLTPGIEELGLEEFDVSQVLDNGLMMDDELQDEMVQPIRLEIFARVLAEQDLPENIRIDAAKEVLASETHREKAMKHLHLYLSNMKLSYYTRNKILDICRLVLQYNGDIWFRQQYEEALNYVAIPPHFSIVVKEKLRPLAVPLDYTRDEIIYYQIRLLRRHNREFTTQDLFDRYSDLTPYIWNIILSNKNEAAESYYVDCFSNENIDEELLNVLAN